MAETAPTDSAKDDSAAEAPAPAKDAAAARPAASAPSTPSEPQRAPPAAAAAPPPGPKTYAEYGIDMVDRDPKHMNDHLKFEFADLIAEPEGMHSSSFVWGISYKVFTGVKAFWYRVLTLLCAIPVSCICGMQFACASFTFIWCTTPALKLLRVEMHYARRAYRAVASATVVPLCDALGHLLGRMRIVHVETDDVRQAPADYPIEA